MDTIGYHYVVEASGCDPEVLKDPNKIREIFLEAAKVGNMEVKASYFFRFSPTGVSGVVIVAESHISVHTWPEEGYAALDVYTCGEKADPEKAVDYILEKFGAQYAHVSEVKRGIKEEEGTFTHMILTWEEKLDRRNEG
ncbi:MAG: S-adenosylmethionine decarboxylase proenzyme [Thermococcales archaeon 44_46]|jgi:S-adenosylmethionine decarboxylase|uniref:adenosylmethionine decarboxylase n=1 Tax=unclassified Thermococcus TaxID=2627626 RepID=UPI0005B27360|nr:MULTISPECIES: adenosylmethionine decarboxylase [unclassified Thermococcus]KUJ98450.1 MAG: S-adenosylmethionine decarboxylase proenzyme [Thermococcales archaeon 44_46]MPW39189.1 adenosylmethionine decarboxylase [Thermococcus sp. 101 C5]